MKGGSGGRRQRARALDKLSPSQLIIFRVNGVDCLGRFVKALTGAGHRALVRPWDAVRLWEGPSIVVSGVVRLATDAEIIAFGARV